MLNAAMRVVLRLLVICTSLTMLGVMPHLTNWMAHKAFDAHAVGMMSLGQYNRSLQERR